MGEVNPNIWIFWARFKDDPELNTINGFHVRDGNPANPRAPVTHYVVLRSNLKVMGSAALIRHFKNLMHEVGHVMKRKHDGNNKTLEDCADRNLTREQAWGPRNLPARLPWRGLNVPRKHCTWVTVKECAFQVTFHIPDNKGHDPDNEENDDDESRRPWCGTVIYSFSHGVNIATFACEGLPVEMCYFKLERVCSSAWLRDGGGVRYASCPVPDADARRPRSGARAAA